MDKRSASTNKAGCVADKNTSNTSIAPADVKYLTTSELIELYTGKTTIWKNLNNGETGSSTYKADGTYDRGTWKITDDGYKCNFHQKRQEESCSRVFKDGDIYITVNKKGTKKYSFTVK